MTEFLRGDIVRYKSAMPNDPDRCMIYLGKGIYRPDIEGRLLDACFDEFCDAIGDSPAGCEICPYQDVECGECRKAYKKDKLDKLEVEE